MRLDRCCPLFDRKVGERDRTRGNMSDELNLLVVRGMSIDGIVAAMERREVFNHSDIHCRSETFSRVHEHSMKSRVETDTIDSSHTVGKCYETRNDAKHHKHVRRSPLEVTTKHELQADIQGATNFVSQSPNCQPWHKRAGGRGLHDFR